MKEPAKRVKSSCLWEGGRGKTHDNCYFVTSPVQLFGSFNYVHGCRTSIKSITNVQKGQYYKGDI